MLPWPGDAMEQPAFVYEAIKICEETMASLRAETDGKMQREIERG